MHLPTEGVNTGKAYTWKAAHIFQDDVTFSQDAAGDLVKAGMGNVAQVSLGGALDQDDVLIKRDVDGGSSYSEAGANLVLQRDVTNVTSEDGNFLEMQTAAGVILSRFDKSGDLIFGETLRLQGSGGYLAARNLAGDAYLDVLGNNLRATSTVYTSYVIASTESTVLRIRGRDPATDAVARYLEMRAANAYASATTNKVGGAVNVYGGAGDGAAGQTAANGGQVSIYGGAAASDLATSNGGDVLLYGGAHGSSGDEGSVKIVNADGSTAIAAFNESKIGFFGVAAAPVTVRAKADYNNWAAFGDVVDALVALGLFDAA